MLRPKIAIGLSLAVLAIVAGQRSVAAPAVKPNILFIAADDLRPELSCYGKKEIVSPNFDGLAQTGMVFQRAYCQQAVCSPSRTSLMTGLRPDSTKVYDLKTHFRDTVGDVVTLSQHFKNHGYEAVGMGKIFHGSLNDKLSWNRYLHPKGGAAYCDPETAESCRIRRIAARKRGLTGIPLYHASIGPPTEDADVPDNAYRDGALADLAVETLKELKQSKQPFFLAVGFHKPHLPFNCPKKYWDLYDPNKIVVPDNKAWPKDMPSIAGSNWGELRHYEGMPKKGLLSDDEARRLIHGYRACVSYVDAQLGRLLDTLKELDLSDNTIIILWGDHGWKLGDYGAWCKHTNFEYDTRAAMLMRVPGAKGNGQKCPALVEFVDIYPTLCELAGLPTPEHLEGTSFAPLADTPMRAWKPAAFSQYPRGKAMGYSMRTDRYRMTEWRDRRDPTKVVAVELYDHLEDPGETVNLAADPDKADVVKELTRRVRAGWNAARPPK